MRTLWAWLGAVLFAAVHFYFLPPAYNLLRQSGLETWAVIDTVRNQLDKSPTQGTFSVRGRDFLEAPDELFEGRSLYPNSNPRNGEKISQWEAFVTKNTPLPEDFFKIEPYIHPQGGSWVWFAHLNHPAYSKRDWLTKNSPRMHVVEQAFHAETNDENKLWKEVLTSITPSELDHLQNEGEQIVVTQNHALLLEKNDPDVISYSVLPIGEFRKILNNSIVELKYGDAIHCEIPEGLRSCWVLNKEKIADARTTIVSLFAIFVAVLALIILQLVRDRKRLRDRENADRLLMVQTLTHELRHPATGLRLSLEIFRDRYDDLDDPLREEFLRMTDQMQKLQRLIFASEQYLKADRKEKLFTFKRARIESFNEYLLDLLENYAQKISIQALAKDTPVLLDPYWFGMCVTNLVKNALMHGRPPIEVRAEVSGGVLKVFVSDSGKGLPEGKLDFKQRKPSTAGGMGLGLSLVARIANMMDGKLEYRAEPRPTFTLSMEMASENSSVG